MQRRTWDRIVTICLAAVLGFTPTALAQRDKRPPTRKSPTSASLLAAPVAERVGAILVALESPEADLANARSDASEVFDWVVAYGDPDRDAAAFRSAALGDRLLSQLEKAPKDKVPALAALLRKCPIFAARVAFLTIAENKDHTTDKVYAMIDRLASSLGPKAEKTIEKYAECAAAVCVVHDNPMPRTANENWVMPADGVDIFRYFVKNEKSLAFGLKDVPASLLVFVVDAAAPIDELEWARTQFGKNCNVEQLYSNIRYDYEHVISGTKKKITTNGFTLQNIKQWGGVCVDQAYFTTEVAKALGIPAAIVGGRDETIGHAWAGVFKGKKGDLGWNFNTGRYESYQTVRGSVRSPVTGAYLSDGELDVIADSFMQTPREREEAHALASAGKRLSEIALGVGGRPYPPRVDLLSGLPDDADARPATTASALALLRKSVQKSPSTLEAWWIVREMAAKNTLTMDDRRDWADALEVLCGKKYPDFTWLMLEPMIASIDDPKSQDAMWGRVAEVFKSRPDLVASVRFAQADQWRARNDPEKAFLAYQEVIDAFANISPMVVPALSANRALLEANKGSANVIPMYAEAWKKIKAPGTALTMGFRRHSNWFRVGEEYAALLEASGNPKAHEVRKQLGIK